MRRLVPVALLCTLVVACGGDDRPPPAPLAELEFNRQPYMGVSCPEPNSIECDRVGLAVGLTRPAERLEATIAGMAVRMHSREACPGVCWEGFLQPAGLRDGPLAVEVENGSNRWTGVKPVDATVEFTARFADGSAARRTVTVPLSAGWG